jgi:hypothetical protein
MFKHEQANTLLSAVAFQGGVERRRVASCFTYSHPLTHNNIFFIYIYIPLSLTLLFLAPSSTYSINHSTHIDVISLRGQSFHGPRSKVRGGRPCGESKVQSCSCGPRSQVQSWPRLLRRPAVPRPKWRSPARYKGSKSRSRSEVGGPAGRRARCT